MANQNNRTFFADFRHRFLRGLAILLPSVLTFWLLWAAYGFVDKRVAEPINAGIRQGIINVAPRVLEPQQLPDWFSVPEDRIRVLREERARQALPTLPTEQLRARARAENFRVWWNDRWYLRFIGLFVAIILFYLAGVLVGNFLGKRLYDRAERLLVRVPGIKQVYPHIKQIVDFLFGGDQKIQFKRVVLVQYPRKGIWTIGLHTGGAIRKIDDMIGECVTVFIPSSPTPFTGYTIIVPKDDVIDAPLTIDEALRFVVSGGVLVPEHQKGLGDIAEEQRASRELTPADAVRASQQVSARMDADD
ncbi:MAG: DUF502 domain-containing protein [Phycisphaerales bacterium]